MGGRSRTDISKPSSEVSSDALELPETSEQQAQTSKTEPGEPEGSTISSAESPPELSINNLMYDTVQNKEILNIGSQNVSVADWQEIKKAIKSTEALPERVRKDFEMVGDETQDTVILQQKEKLNKIAEFSHNAETKVLSCKFTETKPDVKALDAALQSWAKSHKANIKFNGCKNKPDKLIEMAILAKVAAAEEGHISDLKMGLADDGTSELLNNESIKSEFEAIKEMPLSDLKERVKDYADEPTEKINYIRRLLAQRSPEPPDPDTHTRAKPS